VIEYYDRDGVPMSRSAWSAKFGDYEYKRVAMETFDGGVEVSTVWLGLNHQWNPDAPPEIFETMVFGGKLDGEQWRYATEEQAMKGHAIVVQLVLAAYAPGADPA
jgi:hypothetical protein